MRLYKTIKHIWTTLLAISLAACLKPLPVEPPKAEVIDVPPTCIQLEVTPFPAGCNMINVMGTIQDQCCTQACASKFFSPIIGCVADILVASQCTMQDALVISYVCDCPETPTEQNIQNENP